MTVFTLSKAVVNSTDYRKILTRIVRYFLDKGYLIQPSISSSHTPTIEIYESGGVNVIGAIKARPREIAVSVYSFQLFKELVDNLKDVLG